MTDSDMKSFKMENTKLEGAGEQLPGNYIESASRDKALNLLANSHIAFDPNSAEAKRVRWKIDMRIMPMIFVIYCLQLMDKNSLSFAAIMGIKQDTNLSSAEYSWLGSLVYFGYLGGDIPATYLMQRFSLAKYLSVMSALRFFLGAIEVSTVPVAIYITGAFYTKEEQLTRVALWYTTSGWAAIFGGFLAWCMYHAENFRWQGLFILYGAMTFVTGVLLFLFLASSPTDAKWLTEEEKVIALERVRGNKTGTEVWKFSWPQLREAFLDVRFYLIFFMLIATGMPNGGLTAFGPTIVDGFGYDVPTTQLLNMGSGAAQVTGTFLALLLAKRTNRTFAGICTLLLACIGSAMMLGIPSSNNSARYGGYVLVYQFPICIVFIIAFMTAGVAGSTKKFAFGCVYQLGYAIGNIIGPQTYRAHDAPNYYPAKYTMLAFFIVTAILIAIYGWIHHSWNEKREKELSAQPQDTVDVTENAEFADFTDFQMKSFRYPI
ncbi:Major facilitator superfamily domain, general substrate transporter [Penicillium expansum]|uniref:Major facilitator superfamily domain, general substrate transporter n=1 Tax=Penicillium expansum TaxID=27334 RepID=A0A0A2JT31_PENEN|nr:Major facilitator superfamily domain, general substrate transporter [Penicillium expansum]KGO48629.1 Major facilitator superfamily domain, general substrate transporter [Penicillium expansum]KGO51840.1 Major facilitator superfamily domain, general substrate transporter [Penicillium expansum]KGO55385.1 Major facilitator superfamily domain, general substrate transporter [Penicillium expansum]